MKTMLGAAGVALAIAIAAPVAASTVQYQYQGSVTDVFGPDPVGVVAGDQVYVTLRYDTSLLLDVTAAANAAFGTSYASIEAATLTTPGDFLHVSVGSNPITGAFTQADQAGFAPDPLGAGGNPYVLFKDGGFFGVAFFGINSSLAAFDTAGLLPEPFNFVGGSIAVGGPSYGGYFDYAKAIRTDVPEPAVWSLMIVGFGMTGAALRRRRRYA
jgi:PEP-CTERM motif